MLFQSSRYAVLLIVVLSNLGFYSPATAQVPVESEVRQIVTFSFSPGTGAQAMSLYQNLAVPLFVQDQDMLSFRGFREVESSIPLDLMVVSAFRGMSGMDRSNAALRQMAANAGSSITDIYGEILKLSPGHTDQFVEMILPLGQGDPSSKRLTAFVWYQLEPGMGKAFEQALADTVVPWEAKHDIAGATGRFILSDGWHYLRFLAFDSLGDYQNYWSRLRVETDINRVDRLTVRRREVIVASIPEFSVR